MNVLFTRLFVHDINTAISQDEVVMHIHSSSEDFESLAESCFAKLQVQQPVLFDLKPGVSQSSFFCLCTPRYSST